MKRRKQTNPAYILPDHEAALYERIRELVIAARQTVASGVDLVQVSTNYQIGRHIVEHEQRGEVRAGYGKEVIKNLAGRLTCEFGQGFSLSNLKLMRQFFLQFRDREDQIGQTKSGQLEKQKSQTGSGQLQKSIELPLPMEEYPFTLSWSHYVFLLGIKNLDERSFNEIEATGQNWTLRELRRQFDSGLYERLALSTAEEALL